VEILATKRIETKLDHKTLHFLPFLPTKKRTKKFNLKTNWGETELEIVANESVNTYDLVTLMFIVKAYLKKNWYAGFIGEGNNKKEIAGLEVNLGDMCKERGILNKKINRETLLYSILRLSNINLIFKRKNEIEITKYIYQINIDENYTNIKIYANKRFIEFVIKNGILLDLSSFVKLEHLKVNRKEYAILLYTFLCGTKTIIKQNNKKILKWRDKYNEELLFEKLKLNNTAMDKKYKRNIVKKAFEILHKELNIPLYIFNKNEKMYIRSDIFKKKTEVV
jgi:hypothetical protein